MVVICTTTVAKLLLKRLAALAPKISSPSSVEKMAKYCFSIIYHSAQTDSFASPNQIAIRAASYEDIKSLADILSESFHPRVGILRWIYPLLKLGIYEDLRSRLRSRSPHYLCLVACIRFNADCPDNEDLVGTVDIGVRSNFSCSTGSSRYPYISNLAVKNYYRRQGIGRKLLKGCEQTALEWGFQDIYLHVLENNYSARQLYFSSGYRLHRIESSLIGWFFNHPRRLLLNKTLSSTHETG